MRKLATVQKINSISPIEGADALELARIMGWNVVVKKGEFIVGDLCMYFEIDSLLPPLPQFEFLAKGCLHKETGRYRIKTIRLRGQISQGIAFPISFIRECYPNLGNFLLSEGQDLTETLDVALYAEPEPKSREAIGNFPVFIPRTEEIRLQSYSEILPFLRNEQVFLTEKLDGSSMTVYKYNNHIGVCSRNLELKEGNNAFWNTAKSSGILKIIELERGNIAFQGELVGVGINGNRMELKDQRYYIYNIFDIDTQDYYNYRDVSYYCRQYGLLYVPTHKSILISEETDTDYFLQLSSRNSLIVPDKPIEGFVVKPAVCKRVGSNLKNSFKVINNEYLLKHKL